MRGQYYSHRDLDTYISPRHNSQVLKLLLSLFTALFTITGSGSSSPRCETLQHQNIHAACSMQHVHHYITVNSGLTKVSEPATAAACGEHAGRNLVMYRLAHEVKIVGLPQV